MGFRSPGKVAVTKLNSRIEYRSDVRAFSDIANLHSEILARQEVARNASIYGTGGDSYAEPGPVHIWNGRILLEVETGLSANALII
jgi:hypothetical protein